MQNATGKRHVVVLCRLLLLVVAVSAVLCACGKRGPLRPLGEQLPQAPAAVQLEQRGAVLELSWKAPQRNEDGTPAQVAAFRIYRLPFVPGEECPECRDDDLLWREVAVGDPSLLTAAGDFRLDDSYVRSGQGYRYRIEPLTAAGFPGRSAQLSRAVVVAPPVPEALVATADHAAVRLQWSIAGELPGGELLGYRVVRADGAAAFAEQPLNQTLLRSADYEDIGLTNGEIYRYRVSALWQVGTLTVASDWSEVVSATPRSAFK